MSGLAAEECGEEEEGKFFSYRLCCTFKVLETILLLAELCITSGQPRHQGNGERGKGRRSSCHTGRRAQFPNFLAYDVELATDVARFPQRKAIHAWDLAERQLDCSGSTSQHLWF